MTDIATQLATALAGRYSIERELGAGGMATVYLAHDVKHDRKVALKVLKPELGAVLGPERFLAEIRVTANLQHPNLLPLFDSGEAGGLLFYVMPLIEGESLRARLDREKQLPVDDAVRIAAAVAGALDYAHQRGVIHRDLKPENILMQAGQPVVADFGIALAVSKAGGARVTQTGLSLGTPLYMSPEQATGDRVIDGRSDIYSLAAVLYEMLTGEPPHTGSTAQAIIARVLTETPRPVRASRPSVPDHVELAIARALEKLPADRWSTAGQFADVLQGRATGALSEPAMLRLTSARRPRTRRAHIASAAPWMIALVLGGVASRPLWQHRVETDPPATRFTLSIPASQHFGPQTGRFLRFTADGRSVIYPAVGASGATTLFERPLDQLYAREIPGTELEGEAFVSPDGAFVGVMGPGKVTILPLKGTGGTTVIGGRAYQGTWLPNGQIVMDAGRDLARVAATGGPIQRLHVIDPTAGQSVRNPLALADGNTVLFRLRQRTGDGIAVLRLDTKAVRVLKGPAMNPIGVVDGWLVFGRADGSIAAAPFDPATTTTLANPIQVLDSVFTRIQSGVAAALSRDGTLAYVHGSSTYELVLVDGNGTMIERIIDRRLVDPRFSPDGRQVAYALLDSAYGNPDIWVYDFASKVKRRLTTRHAAEAPAWTADGKRIAFVVRDSGNRKVVWWVPVDKSAPEERLVTLPSAVQQLTFTPDGLSAVVATTAGGGSSDIWLVPLAGDRRPISLFGTPSSKYWPSVSYDGRWLAYLSDENGSAPQVYVRGLRGGGSVQISQASGGGPPLWTKDGRLVYDVGDSLIAATLTFTAGPAVVRRQALFAMSSMGYTIHPDGKQVVYERAVGGDRLEIVVVLNWVTELREKLRQAGKR